MFSYAKKDQSPEHNEEAALSRRSFLGRLAFGAALSITLPEAVFAAKKAEAHQAATQTAKSAVRLPKTKTQPAIQANKPAVSLANKQKTATPKPLQVASVDQHPANNRIHDVYGSKKHAANRESHTQDHHSQSQSIIQTRSKTPLARPTTSDSLLEANHPASISHRSLAFQNPHTGDKLSLTYYEQGRYLKDALNEINFLLRDHRTGDVHPIDPELLDQLHDMKQMLGLNQPFDIVCGYRSPLTNAKLHAENAGVANNSFHIHGRAIDIRIERYDLRRIHNAALAMHRGGVGYYPSANFIHLDTGTFRNWTL